MSEGAVVRAVAPTGSAAHGPETRELTFDEGWDGQDRWLRFVDPVLERVYREAMTEAARRRFRIAAAIACVIGAVQPVQVAATYGGSPGFFVITAVPWIGVLILAIVWAGRVGLRGIWGLSCAVSAVIAVLVVAMGVEEGTYFNVTAVGLAVLGIFQIAVIRVAWWVATAMCLVGTALFLVVGLVLGEPGMGANEAILLAMLLGAASLGSRFLEAAERRAFAQGLLVDHLYQRVDRLFRSYLSPDVAEALVERAAAGWCEACGPCRAPGCGDPMAVTRSDARAAVPLQTFHRDLAST